MKKYTFLVFHREYEHFLEQLREAGVVHITQKAEGVLDNAAVQQQMQLQSQLEKTIAEVRTYLPEGTAGSAASDMPAEEMIQAFRQLLQEKQQIEQTIAQTEREKARMMVWGDFSSEKLQALSEAGYRLQYFTCSESRFQEEWTQLYNAYIVGREGKTVYFVTVNRQNETFDIDAEEVTLNNHSAAALNSDIEALNGLLAAKQAQLEAWAIANIKTLEQALEQTRQSIDWNKVQLSTTTLAEDKLKLLEGFCPIDNCAALNEMLQSEHIYFAEEDPTEDDATPIKLRNNWFTRMFECLTGMYGWPVYGEFDPTPILAPFFLLFFALCMGDAGYGILLIIFGILVAKKKINIEMFEGLGPIITTLGIGTLVVGFFLGTAFGMDLSKLFPSIDYLFINGKILTDGGVHYVSKAVYEAQGLKGGYDAQMVLALLIGVFHICLAMVVKAICFTKRYGFRSQLATWGWTLLIVGGITVFVLAMLFSVPMNVTKIVLIVLAAISAIGIYILNTPGRNPLINIGAGLWDTYNMATGILGDVLSYIRLYALGLAGGMLGAAFNNLAMMVMGGQIEGATWQWLPFVIILLIGHLLNIAMSALGAFVHPLRLTFVEYFKNSGYEGKGAIYQPFKK